MGESLLKNLRSDSPQKTQPDRYGRTATYSERLSPLLKMVGGAYRRSCWVLLVQSNHGWHRNARDKSVYHFLDVLGYSILVFYGLIPLSVNSIST